MVSRQRRWQIEAVKQGKCSICCEPIFRSEFCKNHYRKVAIRNRELYRRRVGIPVDSKRDHRSKTLELKIK